eukprot:TRINITY_DN15568_c0_g1_i1.p1 TRINITY_DN15568_c0_g1~~TRINITY_DN15568_c0_g1_i1.p1  ORF type:complete len:282 (-),score=105.27 TRINITY_DN15568_c0_g1_i1:66-911(-)
MEERLSGATAATERARTQAYERIDDATRAMMEGYLSVIEGAKTVSRCDAALGSYSLLVRTAAMARAADELLRLAGEVGGALVLAAASDDEVEDQDEDEDEDDELEQDEWEQEQEEHTDVADPMAEGEVNGELVKGLPEPGVEVPVMHPEVVEIDMDEEEESLHEMVEHQDIRQLEQAAGHEAAEEEIARRGEEPNEMNDELQQVEVEPEAVIEATVKNVEEEDDAVVGALAVAVAAAVAATEESYTEEAEVVGSPEESSQEQEVQAEEVLSEVKSDPDDVD